MIEFPFVRTPVQERAMHAPTAYGMHPEAARILAHRNVDPHALALRLKAVHGGSFETGVLSGFSAGRPFHVGAPAQPQGFGASAGMPGLVADPRLVQFMAELRNLPADQVRGHIVKTFGLDPGDVIVPELLGQAALEWKNYESIHGRVAPIQVETAASGSYFVYDRAGQRMVVDSRIGPSGAVRTISRRVQNRLYTTEPRALKGYINRLTQGISATLANMTSETVYVMGAHDREQERDIALALLNPANYPGSNVVNLGATFQWNGGPAANPVQNVLDLQLAIPAVVNHAVFSDTTWSAAQVSPQLQNILFGRNAVANGILQAMDFALFFGIESVLISKMLVDDELGVGRRVWGDTDLWMGHVNPNRDELTAVRRFRANVGGTKQGLAVRTAFEPDGPLGRDDVYVTRVDSEPYFVGPDFAGVIRNARRIV